MVKCETGVTADAEGGSTWCSECFGCFQGESAVRDDILWNALLLKGKSVQVA